MAMGGTAQYERQEKNLQIRVSIPGKVLGNFQVTYSFCSPSVKMGATEYLQEMSTKKVPLG